MKIRLPDILTVALFCGIVFLLSAAFVLLPAKELAVVEASLQAALKAEMAKGLELKADKSLAAGFRIGSKDGAAYYDFSAEAVADLFSAYLNPRTAAIMKEAAATVGEGSN